MNHDIDRQVDVVLDAGASRTVTVTSPTSGTLSFVCRFHIGGGMTGELAVAGS